MKSNETTDVLIVGAGPTGLSLANALHQLGISYIIIEQKPRLSDTSKATNLMQATQEQLAGYNLISTMAEKSGKMKRLMMYAYGQNLSPRTMHLTESPYPDVLLYGQDKIEASLEESLLQKGGHIQYKSKLVKLNQNADQVDAIIEDDGHESFISAKYVVACDGPWGNTRSFTKCNFEPVKTGKAIRQVDVKLKWKRLTSMDQMWLFYFESGFVVVVPLLDGYTRVLTIEPKENIPDRNPKLEEIKQRLIEVSHDASIELSDAKWYSYSELSMGIAPNLRDGRVVLAGDAGNPILPNGGQGLNTGIQDSMNLAWKLAGVIQEKYSDEMLDTYVSERLTLRQDLEKVQYNSLKYTTSTNWFTRFLISKLGNFLLDKGGEYQMARAFSQLNVNYKKSILSINHTNEKIVKAGVKLNNADIVKALDLSETDLFKLMLPIRWKLVCFIQDERSTDKILQLYQSVKANDIMDLIIISKSSESSISKQYLYYDIDGLAHKINKITRPIILLVRPDQYIGFTAKIDDTEKLKDYMERWFKKSE